MHPEGPATGHLDTRVPDIALSLSKCSDSSQFQAVTACLLCSPHYLLDFDVEVAKFLVSQSYHCNI
jgi:hypothetical protein